MTPSYKTHDPRGWCGDPRRGAALGRTTRLGSYDGSRLTLRRVPLDSGGYDSNGTYFGHGEPLYWCASDDGSIDFCVRATSREGAKQAVRKEIPGAKFYR
jgi:hypothetical protein